MSKTPVMILQELMVKNKCTPEFNLISTSGGTHDPVFEYMVRAGKITATGKGRSKKEAKHDAAKNALKKLSDIGIHLEGEDIFNSSFTDRSDTPDSPERLFLCNHVGQLKEICIEKRLPNPEFTIVSDIGPPHARKFTICCCVGSLKCSATSNTKKSAKQLASKKMFDKLVDTLDCDGIVVPFEEMAKVDEVIKKHDELIKNSTNLSRKISEFPIALFDLDEDKRRNALEILNDNINMSEETLKQALNALDMAWEYDPFTDGPTDKIGITIKLHSDPAFEELAFGADETEAKKLVVQQTIHFLKIMLQ